MVLSTSRLSRHSFKVESRVRIPLGLLDYMIVPREANWSHHASCRALYKIYRRQSITLLTMRDFWLEQKRKNHNTYNKNKNYLYK